MMIAPNEEAAVPCEHAREGMVKTPKEEQAMDEDQPPPPEAAPSTEPPAIVRVKVVKALTGCEVHSRDYRATARISTVVRHVRKKINCAKGTLVSLLHNDIVVDIKLQLHCMSDHDSTVALKYIVMDKQEPDTDDDTPALGSSSSSDDVGVGRRVASSPSPSDSGEYNFDNPLQVLQAKYNFAASSSRSSRNPIVTCALCGQTGNYQCCGRCKAAHYCSKTHQKIHWKIHHRYCCMPICACCKAAGAYKMCAGCLSTYYCSAECQRKHWKREHRKHCPRTTMT